MVPPRYVGLEIGDRSGVEKTYTLSFPPKCQ